MARGCGVEIGAVLTEAAPVTPRGRQEMRQIVCEDGGPACNAGGDGCRWLARVAESAVP